MPFFRPLVFLLLSLPLSLLAANKPQWQSHTSILSTAENYLSQYLETNYQGKTEFKLGSLDKRLKLKACKIPLEGFLPSNSSSMSNTTVGVRCNSEDNWNIYISAKIKVFANVLVAIQPLARGTQINANDLKLEEKNIAALPYGYYSDSSAVNGMIAKRMISANSILTTQMVQQPKMVKRGEHVSLIAESGSIKVRMTGEALADGVKGDLVKVRASDSKRIIDGIVISHGVIKVTL